MLHENHLDPSKISTDRSIHKETLITINLEAE